MISTRSAKQIVLIINKHLDSGVSLPLMKELAAVKSNESFHNSMQLILDLLQHDTKEKK